MQIFVVGRFPVGIRDLWTGLNNALRGFLFFFSDSWAGSCWRLPGSSLDLHALWMCWDMRVCSNVMVAPQEWAPFHGLLHFSQLGLAAYLDRPQPVCHLTSALLKAVYWESDKCCSDRKNRVAKLRVLCIPKDGGGGLAGLWGIVAELDPDCTALLVRGLIWGLVGQVVGAEGFCQPEIIPVRPV